MSNQKGFSAYVILAVLVVLGCMLAALFYQNTQIKSLSEKNGTLKESLTVANEQIETLAGENSQKDKTIKLNDTIHQATLTQYALLAKEKETVQQELENMRKRMPKTLTSDQVGKKTPEEVQNSFIRMQLVWQDYCQKTPTDKDCQNAAR